MVGTTSAFWSSWGWAAATAVLGFIFFGLVFRQYLLRRRMHQLAWSIGLLFYAIAASMEAWSEGSAHWEPAVYRIYIVLAASLVGFLGLGTLYLVARRRRWGDYYFVFLIVCMIVFFVGTFTVQLDTASLVPGITVGGQALGPSLGFPRVMSLPINITGTLLLFGGALWSIVRFVRKREFAYRVWANVLIAAGAALLAALGSRARLGNTAGLYPAEMVSAALMLAGFLLAGTLDKGAAARRGIRAGEAVVGTAAGDDAGGAQGEGVASARTGKEEP